MLTASAARALAALAAWAQPSYRWDRPPPGTLRRGLVWVRSPRVAVALVLALVVAAVAVAMYRRLRRR